LVLLVGHNASKQVLPFDEEGNATGLLDDRDLGELHPMHGSHGGETHAGAHIKRVPKAVLCCLVRAGCFTPEAIAYMHQWVEDDDVKQFLSQRLPGMPPASLPSAVHSPSDPAAWVRVKAKVRVSPG